jgi:hypothetical protein
MLQILETKVYSEILGFGSKIWNLRKQNEKINKLKD